MKAAIRVENLSKRYRLGMGPGGPYRTLRESIMSVAAAPFKWARRTRTRTRPARGTYPTPIDAGDFWALSNVSFEVQPGDVVGIIGRNGAGKSTLLKILSRITEPTLGRALLRGRVGSLLEVGTGFHAELTGRENIYLNGSILGMTRREINRKFDEIVAFSEIEKFLDTPVKRYSSGMYVRLAFAVAAHLEPEILIVDEVLAVGDLAFQRKCLGKMGEVSRSGRTVLFVSHNMAAVEGMCQQGVVLDRGRLRYAGAVTDAVQHYYRLVRTDHNRNGQRFILKDRGKGLTDFHFTEFWITSDGQANAAGHPTGAPLEFHLRCFAARPLVRPVVILRLNKLGTGPVTKLHSERSGAESPEEVQGWFTVSCTTRDLLLGPGEYTVKVGAKSGGINLGVIDDAAHFNILATDFYGTSRSQEAGDGCVVCRQTWEFDTSEAATPTTEI